MIELLAEILILSECWTPKTVVNKPSEFNIHKKVESKPKAINIPCLKKLKPEIACACNLNIQTCKNYWKLVIVNFELTILLNFLSIWKKNRKKNQVIWIKWKKNKKSYKLAKKINVQEKKWKGSVLVVLAQNLFYNWYLFYTNLSYEISIEN